ncbi:MAG: hypothetical protein ACP5OG_04980 [Candidatus Nanoarchaeia archaeon]
MKQITEDYALKHNLKKAGKIRNSDMSKIILLMQRLKEDKKIKYYCMDMIIFEPESNKGDIQVSFWKD